MESSESHAPLSVSAGASGPEATRGSAAFPLGFPAALAASALSGTLYFLSFAGRDIWPLAFLAFAPFWAALEGQTPRRSLQLGWVMGTVLSVGGFYWLQNMLVTFSGFPAPICLLFTLILCAFQGGRYAFFAWVYARAVQRGWPKVPLFLAAAVACELVYPLLFPWYFGASVHQLPAMLQSADLGGPILVGLVLVLVGVALGEVYVAHRLGSQEDGGRRRRASLRWALGAVGVLVANLGYGAFRIAQVDAAQANAPSLHVGLVQGNMGLMQKREDPSEGLRRHLRMTKELREKGVELVVWSESSATFPVRETVYKPVLRDYVGRHLGVPSIIGGVIYRTDPDRERWFNSALALDGAGVVKGRYDKHYLLAFGEYLPFGEMFPVLHEISPNSGKFSPGKSLEPLRLTLGGVERVFTTLICYEDILPRFTNAAVQEGRPDLLVNITNDAWFGDTSEPWEHLALAAFRSIEHRRYMVRSTNSGVSAIIDPVGRVLSHTGTFRAETLEGTVHFAQASTLYEVLGDVPWALVSMVALLAAFVARSKVPGLGPRPSTSPVG